RFWCGSWGGRGATRARVHPATCAGRRSPRDRSTRNHGREEWRGAQPMNLRVSLLACCLIGLLCCLGCGRLPGKPTAADVELEPREIRDFAALFRQNCSGCHGADGGGSGALALNNPTYLAIVSDDALRRAASYGVPGTLMPAFV